MLQKLAYILVEGALEINVAPEVGPGKGESLFTGLDYWTELLDSPKNGTRSKKISPKNKKDLGMACHIPPLKKAKKPGEMPLPSLGPIPLKKCRI